MERYWKGTVEDSHWPSETYPLIPRNVDGEQADIPHCIIVKPEYNRPRLSSSYALCNLSGIR